MVFIVLAWLGLLVLLFGHSTLPSRLPNTASASPPEEANLLSELTHFWSTPSRMGGGLFMRGSPTWLPNWA
jgi:hypothetical protein